MNKDISAYNRAQHKNWKAICTQLTKEEIEAFYNEAGHKNFRFNRLIEPGVAFYIRRGNVREGGGWIIEKENLYYVTDDFIMRCYKSAPVQK